MTKTATRKPSTRRRRSRGPTIVCPPAHAYVPEHVGTYGDEVADLAASVGLQLDPEQRLAIDAMYAHDARGRLVATEFGCAAPRQNIKTYIGKAAALADLVLFDEPLCLWTAHLRATSSEVYRNSDGTGVADLFDNYDHLRRLVTGMSDSDGEQTITLRRPSVGLPNPRLRFLTRSERGGRGLTGRRVTFDEALFLKPSMTSAMVPILSAQSMSGAVQVRYLGSPGMRHSKTWREVRDRGRSGLERRLAWLEWLAPFRSCEQEECAHAIGTAGCALDDPQLVAAANLALGRRMDLEFVLGTERASMEPEDYMRERLGWWDDPPPGDGGALNVEVWAGCAEQPNKEQFDKAHKAFGADLDEAGTGHLAVAWQRPDGAVHCQLAGRTTASTLQERVNGLTAKHGGRAFAGGSAAKLLEYCEPVGMAEFAAACKRLEDLLNSGRLRHCNEPELNDAVNQARWRSFGSEGGQAWQLKDMPAIGPLAALTRALHGLFDEAPPNVW